MNSLFVWLRWLLTFKMTPQQYLLYQALGSVVVNGALTAASLWPKRATLYVPFFGSSGIAADTLLTTFLISSLTVVFGTLFIRRDDKAGRFDALAWTPRNHPLLNLFPYAVLGRAVMFGTLFTLAFAPATLGVFELAQVDGLVFRDFAVFKLLYAVAVGMVVTPVNALWVLTRPHPHGKTPS
ncbi:MAG: hypothetical protein K1X64_08805 [Myxococcaceae bacterium]|nr:hypothetical protein [Myxococcaceae bacterium]